MKKHIGIIVSLILLVLISFSSLASTSYGDIFKSYGDIFGKYGTALDKADKGDTTGALKDYFGALGDIYKTTEELTKTTILQDVQGYEAKIDDFIKYLDTIETKMKEQKTTNEEKEKIKKVLDRIFDKMKKLVEAYNKK